MFSAHKVLLGSAMLSAAILLGSSLAGAQQTQAQPTDKEPGCCGATTPQQTQQQPGTTGQGTMGRGMGQEGKMGRGMGQEGKMGRGMDQEEGMMGPMGMMHGPMLEGRLAYIKAELAITEAQSPAWDAYASAVKARAAGMQGMHDTMMQAMKSGTAMARMDAHVKAMETMTEALKALKPATEALYAALTPEQKQKADQLLSMGCMK